MSPVRPLVLSLLALATLAAPGFAAVPAGFTDEIVASPSAPTDVTFAPDGRLLATSQGGVLRVYSPPTYASATVALSFAPGSLCSNSERGLLGVVVDPDFATNGHVYLFYTAQRPPTTGCPTGNANVVNRVSRFTFSPPTASTIDPATELVLIDNIPSPNGNHNAGDLAFGKDGFLYVSTGEGGIGSAARDESFLGGKILRIDPMGATPALRIPGTNPYALDPSAETCAVAGRTTTAGKTRCQETFAWGLRNPFRFAFDPGSVETRFFINDVGQSTWEEIDLGQPGADYGWNVREGFCATGSTTNCGAPPAGMTNPIYAYQHGVQVPGTTSPTSCNSITGGALVPAGSWPAGYDGTYLFADYVCGWIFQRQPGGTVSDFATNLGGSSATSLTFGTVGSGTAQALYYTTYAGGGQVRRIRYTGSANRAPVASLTADPATGSAPLTVAFDGSGSSDPDGDLSLTYVWSFGDGSTDVETAVPTTMHTYVLGTFTASLRVRDSQSALSDPATITIFTSGPVLSVDDAGTASFVPTPTSAVFRVRRSNPTSQTAMVDYATVDGTAVAGTDYTATSGTLTFSPGSTVQTVAVPVAQDFTPGANRTFFLDLSNAQNAGIVDGQGMGTIVKGPLPDDLDGDGRPDILWRNQTSGQLYAWFMDGTEAHSASFLTPSVFASTVWQIRGLADFDGDGKTDILWHNRATGQVYVWLMDGTRVASASYLTPPAVPDTRWRVELAGDFDADGKPDVLWRNASGGQLYVWFMDGTTVSSTSFLTPPAVADPAWAIRGLGDFDRDGKTDILWHNQVTGRLYLWLMHDTVVDSASFLDPPSVADTRWRVRRVGDFDGDGKPDLLWQHQTTGQLYVWLMNGVIASTSSFLTPSALADQSWQISPQ
jgi:glucose/arabinose dehydrogenase